MASVAMTVRWAAIGGMIEIRKQALAIQALLAVIEWGGFSQAGVALGVPRQTVANRLHYLYRLLGVRDRLNAVLLLLPLIQGSIVVRDTNGRVLVGPHA